MTVDAPVARPRPAATKPSPEQIRARTALGVPPDATARAGSRGAVSQRRRAACRPQSLRGSGGALQGRPAAGSGKFPEPVLNTPKSITVLSKEVLADKNATTLKSAVLSTAGVTLGTGEGGNAFGDRFFIRGFDARNDIFIDGVRDSGVSVRENFFTEQIEILKGRVRPLPAAAPPAARSTSSPSRRRRAQLLQHGYVVRHRQHQAHHARRQPGDQPDAGGARRRLVPGRRCRRPRQHHRRSQRRIRRGEVDPGRRREVQRELHSHRPARHPGLRRALLPAEHVRPPRAGRSPISASTATISTAS